MSSISYNLEPLWEKILDVFKEFQIVCERHNLRYYAAYGTCLGAVRHHGFIPWDDDFDVAMPRQDYEIMKEVLAKELPAHMKFINWENTKAYAPTMYGKIQNCDRDTVIAVEERLGHKLPHGIYIDIFPLDGVPKPRFKLYAMKVQITLLDAAQSSLCGAFETRRFKTCCKRLLGWCVRKMFWKISNLKDIAHIRSIIERRYPFGNGSLCGCIFSPDGVFKDVCDYEVYGSGRRVSFGDLTIVVPQDFDTYLKMFYGDYMQLPPENKRIPVHGRLPEASWKFGPDN